jgi:hypothetical protein
MHMGLYVFFIPLYFALHVSGAICTHPQEHKLQRTAKGMCNGYGMLIHWNSLLFIMSVLHSQLTYVNTSFKL